MLDIFLWYSREDGAPAATRLRKELDRANYSVWQDIQEVQGGQPWEEQLREALDQSQVVIVLLTPDAVASGYVTLEWKHARLLKRPIIPILVAPVGAIPDELVPMQRHDFTNPDTYGVALVSLLDDLARIRESMYERVRGTLSPLLRDDRFASLRTVFEKLGYWIDARLYQPAVLGSLVDIMRHTGLAELQRRSTIDLLNELLANDRDWNAQLRRQVTEHRDQFEAALNALRPLVRAGPVVPIVIVAMNEQEAGELASGVAFDGYPPSLRQEFAALQALLESSQLGDWARRYRARSQDWQPFSSIDGGQTIRELLTSAFETLDTDASPLIPEFRDIQSLNDAAGRPALKKLRRGGCILVIDSISIRHPKLQRALQQSVLDATPDTSVVTIAPAPTNFDLLRQVTIVLQLTLGDLEFIRRRDDDDEELEAFNELTDAKRLSRWVRERARKFQPEPSSPLADMHGQLFGGGSGRR